MLGLEGIAVPLGLGLTLGSAVLCIGYGLRNWNRGHVTEDELASQRQWRQEEDRVEETL